MEVERHEGQDEVEVGLVERMPALTVTLHTHNR